MTLQVKTALKLTVQLTFVKLTLHRNLCTCCLGFFHFIISSTHILPSISSVAFLNIWRFSQWVIILGPCDGWSWFTAGLTRQLEGITLIDSCVLRCFSDRWWHWKPIKKNNNFSILPKVKCKYLIIYYK